MTKLDFNITKFKTISDSRGKLTVFLRESEILDKKKKFGQIYFVTFKKKGSIRGNHYHKQWREWFGIIEGKVKVIVEDVRTKRRKEIILDAKKDRYTRIETGPFIAHAIQSLSDKSSLLSYSNNQWRSGDTYKYKLI